MARRFYYGLRRSLKNGIEKFGRVGSDPYRTFFKIHDIVYNTMMFKWSQCNMNKVMVRVVKGGRVLKGGVSVRPQLEP